MKSLTWASQSRRNAAFARLLKNPTADDVRWALVCGISPAAIQQALVESH